MSAKARSRGRLTAALTAAMALLALAGGCGLTPHLTRWQRDLPPFTHAPGGWTTAWVPMADGVKLHARVLLPADRAEGERVPTILMRNPYPILPLLTSVCETLAGYGIGCVVQDVRGRLESEGEWVPLVHEPQDGADTLDWLLAQPWAGDVALYGVSYLAGTAYAAAAGSIERHGALSSRIKTLVVSVFATEQRALFRDGLFPHELLTAWAVLMPDSSGYFGLGERYRKALATMPFADADLVAMGGRKPMFQAWLEATATDDAALWRSPQSQLLEGLAEHLDIPVLLFEGFDDPFLEPALAMWRKLKSRDRSLLVLSPTNHLGRQSGDTRIPDLEEGNIPWGTALPWVLHHLKGAPLSLPVGQVLSRGRPDGVARLDPAWPPPTTPVVLAPTGALLPTPVAPCAARSLVEPGSGAGARLDPAALTWRYDPRDPWRSPGSARALAFLLPGMDGQTPGPVVIDPACARRDLLRFISPRRGSPLRVVGQPELTLRVRSSAPDTAFVAKLVDIREDGSFIHVSDAGAVLSRRARRLETEEAGDGASHALTLIFSPTDWAFLPGHRVGLLVSSSLYPSFSAHPNEPQPWYAATTTRVAEQTLFVGGGTQLLLPELLDVPPLTASPNGAPYVASVGDAPPRLVGGETLRARAAAMTPAERAAFEAELGLSLGISP